MGILEGVEIFVLTVESGSFAAAARRLHVTPSAVSRRVALLEAELGVPLLARTTRTLSLTHDGRSFYERCRRILEDVGEARDALAHVQKTPSGSVRVDAPVTLGRLTLAPRLPEFLAQYPDVTVELMLRDQLVDAIAEGSDVLLRIGTIGESALIVRRLGEARVFVCGAPAYLKRHGVPRTPRDLPRHLCVGYLRDGRPGPWRFLDGASTYEIDIQGRLHANDATALVAAAIAGQGLVHAFDFLVEDALRDGSLVRVLADHESPSWPISALYPKNRHLVPKVAVFLDFLTELFAPKRQKKRAR